MYLNLHSRSVAYQKTADIGDVGIVLEGSLVEPNLFAEMGNVLFIIEREQIVLKEGICDVRNLDNKYIEFEG